MKINISEQSTVAWKQFYTGDAKIMKCLQIINYVFMRGVLN